MLLRGRNTVGYTPYPTEVTEAFIQEATATGIDIFRIFDVLNDVEQIVDAGAHILAIKDMAGLLRPVAAKVLVSALRERFELPVHLHIHDTTGGQMATLLAAIDAGVDAVDVASAAMAGNTSQPPMSALVAALEHTERDTGFDLRDVCDLEPYWEAVRALYQPFKSGLTGPTGRVYTLEIPGGQLTNLLAQACALGLASRFEDIESTYAGADRILGRLIKVTPSSKVVGDLALQLVAKGVTADEFAADLQKFDIPDSVICFLGGELGNPPGGWPEPFRTKVLAGRVAYRGITPISDEDRKELNGSSQERRNRLNHLLFPGPTKDIEQILESYGDLSVIGTESYLFGLNRGEEVEIELERGVRLLVGLEAVDEPDIRGMRSVMFTLNGQLRPIQIRDNGVENASVSFEKANRTLAGEIAAPYSGSVTVSVQEGQKVNAGQSVATIEAMKMESSITSPIAGTVSRVATGAVQALSGGDLILVVS